MSTLNDQKNQRGRAQRQTPPIVVGVRHDAFHSQRRAFLIELPLVSPLRGKKGTGYFSAIVNCV